MCMYVNCIHVMNMKQSIYNSKKESVACNYGTRSDELADRIAAGQAIGIKAYHLQSSANHSVHSI